jgi:hypothetical protein
MRIFSFALALGLFACSGSSPPEVDADPRGPTCTKALYDLCSTEHDCMSANCKLFMTEGFQVCSQTCDANNPCPAPPTGTATCNAMGICKPDAANHCHL